MICWDLESDFSMLILSSTSRKIDMLATEISIFLREHLFARELISSEIDFKRALNTSETWSCT
jgi:hypothetical protein